MSKKTEFNRYFELEFHFDPPISISARDYWEKRDAYRQRCQAIDEALAPLDLGWKFDTPYCFTFTSTKKPKFCIEESRLQGEKPKELKRVMKLLKRRKRLGIAGFRVREVNLTVTTVKEVKEV